MSLQFSTTWSRMGRTLFEQSSALDREQHDIQDFVPSCHVVSFKYTLGNHKHTHLTLLHKPTLIPRFTGFTGKYCFMPRCPLNLTMASSTDKFLPGYSVSTIFNNMIQNEANFEQLVMSWIFLRNLSCVGIQMKVLRQFVKMIFWHAFSTDGTPMSGSLLQ